jgi:hypothetical protein
VPDDTREDAKHEADRANDFFDRCIARGRSEQIAAQLTSAYILGRLRREKKEGWEPE